MEMSDDKKNLAALAAYVRRCRESRGLDMRAAAVLGDLSPSTWNGVEQGRPSRGRTYGRIERALGIPEGTLSCILDTGKVPERRPTRLRPANPGAERIARLIKIMQDSDDVPRADRDAIVATMTATLAHMQERPEAQPEREVG